ncbi:MAG: hypothetical protein R3B13_05645 [Polyangiaceae bacterium]
MSLVVSTIAFGLASGCAPRCPTCPASAPAASPAQPSYVAPVLSGAAPTAAAPSEKRPKLAVLPIEDSELFRDERAQLRNELFRRLTALASDHELISLSEVDAQLRAVNSAGQACAYDETPLSRRARNKGWRWSEVMFVHGPKQRGSELWVQLNRYGTSESFAAPWDSKADRMQAYGASFASLRKLSPDAGVLGGLGSSAGPQGEQTAGALKICEKESFFKCRKESQAWLDVSKELTACFTGVDEGSETALVDGSRCELPEARTASTVRGKREACLCAALVKSAGVSVRSGRRKVNVSYEAPDIAGRPRPRLRVIDVEGLFAEADWDSVKYQDGGKTRYRSEQRLVVDNLDALSAPLARCKVKAGTQLTAELSVDSTGHVAAAKVTSGAANTVMQCLDKALARGVFGCPGNSEGATLRIGIRYPD